MYGHRPPAKTETKQDVLEGSLLITLLHTVLNILMTCLVTNGYTGPEYVHKNSEVGLAFWLMI